MIEIREKYTEVLLGRAKGETLAAADLEAMVLWSANLKSADLRGARMRAVQLPMASLRGADLRRADLREADLRYTDMCKVRFQGADLTGADLTGAELRGSWYDAATRWPEGLDPAARQACEVPVRTGRGEVLLAEDDGDFREFLIQILSIEGYRVFAARDGESALEYLYGQPPPDVILLDLMMPGMNGWVFRTELRRDAALCGIPVVVLSGHAEAERQAARLEAAAFIAKPLERGILLDTLARLCPQPQPQPLGAG